MRKFNHWKALKVAWNIIYVASFLVLVVFTITNAKESQVDYNYTEEDYCPCGYDGSYIPCLECDE